MGSTVARRGIFSEPDPKPRGDSRSGRFARRAVRLFAARSTPRNVSSSALSCVQLDRFSLEVPVMNGFSTEEDSHDGPPAPPFFGQSCCLIEDGERCGRSAGNASFSKRIQKSISQRKLKLDIDKSVRHLYICDFHKNFIQSVRNKRKRKTSDDGGESPDHDVEVPEVDLFQLQVNTLRRYKRHYKIQTRPGLNKAQLAETVSRHFRNIPVNEKETLTYFIYMVKSSKSRLDQKSDGSKQVE
ncbi:hypothetical protein QQF64_017033 [Cirrhinus molitorella]|uniref:Histone deacetylase complex subunit SAP30L n=4 Tax=Labeonini TaxID=2743697 RepID=A0ABR3LJ59_9TELE